VPINVLWQDWLESTFPGNKTVPVKDGKDEKGAPKTKTVLDVKNTLIKFAMDQTVGASFNIPIFLSTIGATKGLPWEAIVENIRKVRFPLQFFLIACRKLTDVGCT